MGFSPLQIKIDWLISRLMLLCRLWTRDDAPYPFLHSENFFFLYLKGYFLLFESMLDSVLHARDLYLADNGSGRFMFFSFKCNQIPCSSTLRGIPRCPNGWNIFKGLEEFSMNLNFQGIYVILKISKGFFKGFLFFFYNNFRGVFMGFQRISTILKCFWVNSRVFKELYGFLQ